MRYFLPLILLASLLLTACAGSLLPEPALAPQQWLLKRLPSPQASQLDNQTSQQIYLAVERPTAPTPLRTREIWYRSQGHQLSPFSEQVWAESLDQQIQQRVSDYLGQQAWLNTSLHDQPGYRSAYRLRITLQEWYLNTQTQQLDIALQINLLDATGKSLLQQQWVAHPDVAALNTTAMLEVSQKWLDEWAAEVAFLLYERLKQP